MATTIAADPAPNDTVRAGGQRRGGGAARQPTDPDEVERRPSTTTTSAIAGSRSHSSSTDRTVGSGHHHPIFGDGHAIGAPSGRNGCRWPSPPRSVRRPVRSLGVGVVVWLASELMFFAGLFAAYFTLRSSQRGRGRPRAPSWPTGRTAAGHRRAHRVQLHHAPRRAGGRARRPRAARCAGCSSRWRSARVFLTNQALEYAELPLLDLEPRLRLDLLPDDRLPRPPRARRHRLHGRRHRDRRRRTCGPRPRPPVTVCAYYWHFVDVVWVAMFATIYLLK